MRTFAQIARMIFVATVSRDMSEHDYDYWSGFTHGRRERKAPPLETEKFAEIARLFEEGLTVDEIADSINMSLHLRAQMMLEGWVFPDEIDPAYYSEDVSRNLEFLNGLGLDLTLEELLFYNHMILAEAMRIVMLR